MTHKGLTELTTEQLTPAQVQLLDFVSHLDAGSLYESLHTMLSISIGKENEGFATPKAVSAWYFTFELLRHVHLIAAERPAK